MSDTYIEPQEQMKIIEALQFVAQKSKQYTNKKIEQIELIPGPEGPEGPMGPQGEKGDPGDTPELAEWVLAPEKPEYTAEEVGALPADTIIPKEDFVAEYDTTTFVQVRNAYEEGRTCWVLMATGLHPLGALNTGEGPSDLSFSTGYYWNGSIMSRIHLTPRGWETERSENIVITQQISSSVPENPSNQRILSEKATIDALSVVTNNVQTQLNNKSNAGHTHTANYIKGDGYLNTHPESESTIIPFIYNDLAFLEQRGGSCKIYQTQNTDFTIAQLNEESDNIINDWECLFDGSPSYAFLYDLKDIPLIIDIILPQEFQYNNKFYIDFGNEWWAPTSIAVYTIKEKVDTVFVLKKSTNSLQSLNGKWSCTLSHDDINGKTGFNKLRLVLTGFHETSENILGGRIACIGLLNYNSKGVTETLISRGGCSGIYGDLIPHADSNINLGSSEKHWQTVYADNIVGVLPTITTADAGKFLRISSEGKIIVEQLTNVSEVGA